MIRFGVLFITNRACSYQGLLPTAGRDVDAFDDVGGADGGAGSSAGGVDGGPWMIRVRRLGSGKVH